MAGTLIPPDMYWDRRVETMERSALERLQLKRLKTTLRRVEKSVPFYQQKFAERGRGGQGHPVAGGRAPAALHHRGRPARHLSRGPAGGALRPSCCACTPPAAPPASPRRSSSRASDVDNAAELIARCLVMTGVTGGGRLPEHDDLRPVHRRRWSCTTARRRSAAWSSRPAPATPSGSSCSCRTSAPPPSTSRPATPSTSPASSRAKASTRAATWPSARPSSAPSPTPRRPAARSSRPSACDVYNSYGLSEMNGPGVAFECEHKDGMHLWEDNYLLEIIDPDTGEPLPDGRNGRAGADHPVPRGHAHPALPHARHHLHHPRALPLRPHPSPPQPHHRPLRRHAHHARREHLPAADRAACSCASRRSAATT